MPGSRLPFVSDDYLHMPAEHQEQQSIQVGSNAWYHWLAMEENRSFAFRNHLGTFTVRCERKRNGWYWYLYRKQNGKLRKVYLGKAEELSLERLRSGAESLIGQGNSSHPEKTGSAFERQPSSASFIQETQPSPSVHTLPEATFVELEKVSRQTLPVQGTPLVGRQQEMTTICSLLRRPEVRLLSLTGTAGIGKTRLGMQAATELNDEFDDGVCFVPLAPIHDATLVVPAIAQVLGIKEVGGQFHLSQLKAFLRDKNLLLLLDNFEQVLAAAPGLSELLASCPQLKVLVTSRALLHISGEYEFLVPPLDTPNLKQLPTIELLLDYASVALFLQRACMIKPEFEVIPSNARYVAEICVRLDGLPLAIELAAARIKLLPPQALLSRLEHRLSVLTVGEQDAPLRQQTLRDTLRWSYDLLDRDEQWLFRHLAVFVGGCQLVAVEALCSELGGLGIPLLDGIASLVDKSLLQVITQDGEEPRLMMLETVREYGLECLIEEGEWDQTRRAHVAIYYSFILKVDAALLGIKQDVWPAWRDREQERWLDWEEKEYENLRTALNVLLEFNEIEVALEFAVGFANVWFFRGYPGDGRRIMQHVLSAKGVDSIVSHAKGWSLYIAGWIAFYQSDERQALSLLKESIQVFRNLDFMRGVAACLTLLGNLEHHRGNMRDGDAMFDESLALYRRREDHVGIAYALLSKGILVFFRSDIKRAQSLCEESLEHSRAAGHNWLIASNLHYVGWALLLQGAYAKARQLSEESMVHFKAIGHAGYAVEAQIVLAEEMTALGDMQAAQRLLEEALVRGRELESRDDIARALCGLGRLALRQGNLDHARTLYEEAVAILKEAEIPDRVQWVLASCLEGIGDIDFSQGQTARAVRLFARADALRASESFHNTIGIERPIYERLLAQATARLGERAFAALWAEGQQMTTEQVLLTQSHKVEPSGSIMTPGSGRHGSITPPAGLTKREFEVLLLVAKGLTNAQIAQNLVISLTTVNSYLSSIYSKLGVSSRLGAMRFAIDHQLLS